MKGRSKVSGGRAKAQGRDASKLKHRSSSKGTTREPSSAAGEHTEVARLTHELNEALEQQSVTSELLGIISSGAAELEPIFRAILEKATGLCDAEIRIIYRWDGDALYLVAAHNVPPAFEELQAFALSSKSRYANRSDDSDEKGRARCRPQERTWLYRKDGQ